MKILIALILVSGLLLISLALNYIFYKKAFLPLHAARLDPIGLQIYPASASSAQSSANKSSKAKVMFYGDSRALSWVNPALDQYDFINRAIGGQTSIQIAARFQAHVVAHQPNIMIIQLCVNDLKMIPLFPKQKDEIIENCKKNIQKIIQQAHDIKASVILSTVFPLGDISIERKVLGMREQPIIDAIDKVNIFIKSLADKDKNTLIFNAYDLLKSADSRKIDERYSHDWLHLNTRGYEVLNKNLAELIIKFK
jgi:lysophospholipase L1-like esterase